MRTRVAIGAAAAAILLTLPTAGAVGGYAGLRAAGPEQVVFDWSRDSCVEGDIPDVPARAIRSADGMVQLITSETSTRRLVGRDLDHVRRDCTVVMRSRHDADPSAWDDNSWLEAPYTVDGKTVYALVHDEYHGSEHPGRCPSADLVKCWYNAVTLAVSHDGGASYSHAAAPAHLVAALPFRYVPDTGPVGIMGGSNIVRNPHDKAYYAFVYQEHPARRGACLIRTKTLAQPGSWRAWNGKAFALKLADPYRATAADPYGRLCAPLTPALVESVSWNSALGRFVAIGSEQLVGGGARIFYALSADLVHWGPLRTLLPVELTFTYRCGDADPVAYASLLDPTSPSRSFDVTGAHPYLYFTRFNYANCQMNFDRDLVRVPVELTP